MMFFWFGSWLAWMRSFSAVRIEALDASHAAGVAALHEQAFARPWSALEFEGLLAERNVFADGLFVGYRREPSGFILSRRAADEAELLSVALASDARGRGHARALLAHHLQALAQAGVRTVHLEVEEGNAPALALYRRAGFREAGRRPAYYGRPDGSRGAAITMSLGL